MWKEERRKTNASKSPMVPATRRQESGMGPHGNMAGLLEIQNHHVGCCQDSFLLHLLLFLSLTPFCKYASLSSCKVAFFTSWSIVASISRELYVTAPVTNGRLTWSPLWSKSRSPREQSFRLNMDLTVTPWPITGGQVRAKQYSQRVDMGLGFRWRGARRKFHKCPVGGFTNEECFEIKLGASREKSRVRSLQRLLK